MDKFYHCSLRHTWPWWWWWSRALNILNIVSEASWRGISGDNLCKTIHILDLISIPLWCSEVMNTMTKRPPLIHFSPPLAPKGQSNQTKDVYLLLRVQRIKIGLEYCNWTEDYKVQEGNYRWLIRMFQYFLPASVEEKRYLEWFNTSTRSSLPNVK